MPVAHGMYFAGGLLEPPPPPKQHTRRLSMHLGDSDTESSNSSCSDSASSDEEVNRRQPYYQVYKLEKREKRLEGSRTCEFGARTKKDETTFRIPPSQVLDPRGRPKSATSFTAPAVSPPRNPRVTLGLGQSPTKRKINRVSRMRDGSAAAPAAAATAGSARRRRRPYSNRPLMEPWRRQGGAHSPRCRLLALFRPLPMRRRQVAEGRRDQRRHLGLAPSPCWTRTTSGSRSRRRNRRRSRPCGRPPVLAPLPPGLQAHTRSEMHAARLSTSRGTEKRHMNYAYVSYVLSSEQNDAINSDVYEIRAQTRLRVRPPSSLRDCHD